MHIFLLNLTGKIKRISLLSLLISFSLIGKAQVPCIHYVNPGRLLSPALKLGGSIFKETLIQHLIHVALISSALYQNNMKIY